MLEASVRLFISYSHRDEALRQELDMHLAPLKRKKVIESWHDRKIQAGMNWANEIDGNLNKSDIILLLISPDFVASEYCYNIELDQAIKRHEAGEAIVVPVILEPCDWSELPFANFQTFPKDAKAITTWENANEALLDVVTGIRKVAEELFAKRKLVAEQKQANRARYLQKIEEALSDGVISIVERDTLDELQAELGLTEEEAKEIEAQVYQPYSRYQENLNKYKQTIHKLIQKDYYPFTEEIKKDLENRQRDLGLKHEDVEQIIRPILEEAETKYQERLQTEDAEQHPQLKLKAETQRQLERQRQQEQEQEEYESKLRRYEEEFFKAVQGVYPLSETTRDGLSAFLQSLELNAKDAERIEQPILAEAEAKYQEKLQTEAAERQQQLKLKAERQQEQQRLEQEERKKIERERPEQEKQHREHEQIQAFRSEKGIDYTHLRNLLRDGKWKEADAETWRVILMLLDEKYGMLGFSQIREIPCTDFHTINQLWLDYSDSKFGFTVQNSLYNHYNKDLREFVKAIGWQLDTSHSEDNCITFDISAPVGHLPSRGSREMWVIWNYQWHSIQDDFILLGEKCSQSCD